MLAAAVAASPPDNPLADREKFFTKLGELMQTYEPYRTVKSKQKEAQRPATSAAQEFGLPRACTQELHNIFQFTSNYKSVLHDLCPPSARA